MNNILRKERTLPKEKSITFNGINNLFEVYEELSYEPEFYDDNTLLIRTPAEFIVSYIDNEVLSLGDLHKLWVPLKEISEFTGIKNYIIISKQGFEDNCFELEGYSVRLESMEYIEDLLVANKESKPLELLPHNQLAYKNLMNMWKTNKLASIIQATGTGKSYIITKVLQNCTGNILVICPTVDISKQFLELFKESGIETTRVDLYTYAKVSRLTKSDLASIKYDLIVIDEFHRAGADTWSVGVNNLLSVNPRSKVLGTTATPIRYLDDRRNMADEMFEGNIASSIDLFEAIARGILPVPKYIEALYDITPDIDSLTSDVSRSTMPSIKKEALLEDIKKFKISWDGVKTISNIIRKHFTTDVNKVMVFCKDVSHIKEMVPLVEKWFEESGIYDKVNSYMTYSTTDDKRDELNEFKKDAEKGEVNLLFSVDRVSEGIHVGATAVIFLRNTCSNNVLLQQIGRALAATQDTTPIILDLINNVDILESQNFYESVNNAIDNFNTKKKKLNLMSNSIIPVDVNFSVIDETKDFVSFLKDTLSSANRGWDDMLKLAVECKERTGWFPGPATPNEDPQLIKWVARQRKLYTANSLTAIKLEKLNSVNFAFSLIKEKWFKMYDALLQYMEDEKLETFFRHTIKDKKLKGWIQVQKGRAAQNIIEKDEYKLLIDVGISFNQNKDLWDYYIDRLLKYYKVYGRKFPSITEDRELHTFWSSQRQRYKEGALPEDKIKLLDSINFVWYSNDSESKFLEKVNELKEYIKEFGTNRVSQRSGKYKRLAEWVIEIRMLRRRGQLPQNKIDILNSLDFCWEPKTTILERTVNELVDFLTRKKELGEDIITTEALRQNMNTIRKKYANNELEQKYINKLNNAGFDWNPTKNVWTKRLNQLIEYNSIYGTFKVNPTSDYPGAKSLYGWFHRQQTQYKKGTYPEDKIKDLKNIGLDLENIK